MQQVDKFGLPPKTSRNIYILPIVRWCDSDDEIRYVLDLSNNSPIDTQIYSFFYDIPRTNALIWCSKTLRHINEDYLGYYVPRFTNNHTCRYYFKTESDLKLFLYAIQAEGGEYDYK